MEEAQRGAPRHPRIRSMGWKTDQGTMVGLYKDDHIEVEDDEDEDDNKQDEDNEDDDDEHNGDDA